MTKCYKMLLLRALLALDALPGDVDVDQLSAEFASLASRSARLKGDMSVDPADRPAVKALLLKNPIAAWTGGKYFALRGQRFACAFEEVHRSELPSLVSP